jgi:hypothetical protein
MDTDTFIQMYGGKIDIAKQFLAARGILEPLPIANGPPTNFQTIEARILAWREKALAIRN